MRLNRFLDWFTYALMVAVGGSWVFIVFNVTRYTRGDPPAITLVAFFFGPLVVLIALFLVTKVDRQKRFGIQLSVLGLLLALYVSEGVLSIDLSAGGHNLVEGVSKLRAEGVNAVQILDRKELTQIRLGPSGLRTIGQLPNADIVHCNASGSPSVFQSDQFGFRNPTRASSASARFVALGDSFTVGSCIPDGQTYVDLLRSSLGPVLSLATPGNGPLGNLAAYREFVQPDPSLRFEYLIWFHYQNDLTDLEWEKSSHLLRYFQPEFSQNLRSSMQIIRGEMAALLERPEELTEGLAHRGRRYTRWDGVLDFVKCTEIRRYVGLLGRGGEWTPPDLNMFGRVLSFVRADVRSREAKMIFVYIPSYDDIRWPGHNKEYNRWDSLRTARELGLDVLDLTEIITTRDDPFDIFPDRRGVHYNELGHRVIASNVISFIDSLDP